MVYQIHLTILISANFPFLGLIQCPVIIKLANQALAFNKLLNTPSASNATIVISVNTWTIGGNVNLNNDFVVLGYAETQNIL